MKWPALPKIPKITKKDVSDYWANEGPKAVLIVIYVVFNIALILESAFLYRFHYTNAYSVLGFGVVGICCNHHILNMLCVLCIFPPSTALFHRFELLSCL